MSDQQASEVEDLERIYADTSKDPIQIPYGVIKSITKNFAQVIGKGASGVVYLGALKNGMVAVKKLSLSTEDLSEKQFLAEVKCLMRVKHPNIVRFLGYCTELHGEVMEINGKLIIADVPQRLLCFEYVPNGSLHDYLQEKTQKTYGFEWNIRYQILKGICAGLHYLHQERIYHLDLKPGNVLLGIHMEPKITDFGLSRCIDENQSTICTVNIFGTPGYMAPELIDKKKISFKSDIFSLGIIMARLLTGSNGSITENSSFEGLNINHMESYSQFSSLLTELAGSQGKQFCASKWHEALNTECQQMKTCIEVAKNCVKYEPYERPTIANIVDKLNETETTTQKVPQVVNEPRNDPSSSLHQVVKRFKALSVQTLHEYSRSQWSQEKPPRYQVVFKSNMDGKIEKGKSLKTHVALVDCNSGQTVKDGPLASATVELVVIDAKFNEKNNHHNWSIEEFRRSIKKARQGKSATVNVDESEKSIVSNGRFNLENGDKHHCDFSISENSGSKRFRLGVMVVSTTQERVLEGLSNPFFVRGHDRNRSPWKNSVCITELSPLDPVPPGGKETAETKGKEVLPEETQKQVSEDTPRKRTYKRKTPLVVTEFCHLDPAEVDEEQLKRKKKAPAISKEKSTKGTSNQMKEGEEKNPEGKSDDHLPEDKEGGSQTKGNC